MAVEMVSTWVNIESKPRVRSMIKKRRDQNWGAGILVNASGYTSKTKPGPSFTTSSIERPDSLAMKPANEKTTNPANTDVPQLMKATSIASL